MLSYSFFRPVSGSESDLVASGLAFHVKALGACTCAQTVEVTAILAAIANAVKTIRFLIFFHILKTIIDGAEPVS